MPLPTLILLSAITLVCIVLIWMLKVRSYRRIFDAAKKNNSKKNTGSVEPAMNGPKISYIANGPSGYVVYSEKWNSFQLYYEFSGGNCVATVFLPTDWEKETNTPLSEKNRILDIIANQVIKDQAPGTYAEIEDGKWLHFTMK